MKRDNFTAICVVITLVLFTAAVSASSTEAGAPPVKTKLVLDPSEIDFGEVPVNASRTQVVTVKNPTDAPITIKNLKASCGCTEPHMSATTIAPGKSEAMDVKYNARLGAKKASVIVSFLTDEPGDPSHVFFVHATVKYEFSVAPETLQFGRMAKGESKSLQAVVKHKDGKAFNIQRVSSAQRVFAVKWEPVAGSSNSAYTVSVTATGVHAGPANEGVTLVTDHPTENIILINLSADIKSDLTFDPPVAIAAEDEKGSISAFEVVAKLATPGKLAIVDVTEATQLPLDFTATPADDGSVKLSIRFKDSPPPNHPPLGQFRISTNIEDVPLPLPYRFATRVKNK